MGIEPTQDVSLPCFGFEVQGVHQEPFHSRMNFHDKVHLKNAFFLELSSTRKRKKAQDPFLNLLVRLSFSSAFRLLNRLLTGDFKFRLGTGLSGLGE